MKHRNMLHAFYSRTDARKSGFKIMRTKRDRKVRVTETSPDGSKQSNSADISYVGLVRNPQMSSRTDLEA